MALGATALGGGGGTRGADLMPGRRASGSRRPAAFVAALVVALAAAGGAWALRAGNPPGPAPAPASELPLPSAYWEPSVSLELVDGPEGAAHVEAWAKGQPAALELHVLFELYSSWCPRCKKFRPHYNKIARVFNPRGSGERAGVLVAHMACDKEKAACKRLGAEGYPHLAWTTPEKVNALRGPPLLPSLAPIELGLSAHPSPAPSTLDAERGATATADIFFGGASVGGAA